MSLDSSAARTLLSALAGGVMLAGSVMALTHQPPAHVPTAGAGYAAPGPSGASLPEAGARQGAATGVDGSASSAAVPSPAADPAPGPAADSAAGSPLPQPPATIAATPHAPRHASATPRSAAAAGRASRPAPAPSPSPSGGTTSVAGTAAAPAAVGSGSAVPAADLPGWHLVLSQDFRQDAPLGQFASVYKGWAGYDGAHDTSGNGTYDSATTASVSGGVLHEDLHTDGSGPKVMALTPPSGPAAGQTYGRYAVRFRSQDIPGYKIAWLLWPASDQWSQGEVDFPEADLDGSIQGFAHDVTGNPGHNAWAVSTGAPLTAWHTAVIEWAPGRLTFSLDGQQWTSTDSSAVPTDPMRWVLQTETAENGPAPDSATSGRIDIDWVAAWSRA